MDCAFPGCGWPERVKGHCAGHYAQLRQGKELRPIVRRTQPPVPGTRRRRGGDEEGSFSPSRLFVWPDEQMSNVRTWNNRWDWGFTEEDFHRLEPSPAWPTTGLRVVVLVPYLDTIANTFLALYQAGTERVLRGGRLAYAEMIAYSFYALRGSNHCRGLRWEVIDLGSEWNQQPAHGVHPSQDPATSPHAGIMAAHAHFPAWVRSMDGKRIPGVVIPGYASSWTPLPLSVGGTLWRYIGIRRNPGQKDPDVFDTDYVNCGYAVPRFVAGMSVSPAA